MKIFTHALGGLLLVACSSTSDQTPAPDSNATGGFAGTSGTGGFGTSGSGGSISGSGGSINGATGGFGATATGGISSGGVAGAGGLATAGTGGIVQGTGGFPAAGSGGIIEATGGSPPIDGTGGTGGFPVATGGSGSGTGGASGTSANACGALPSGVPFATTGLTDGTGPNGQYTVVRPTTLGENGFKHPIATWGNGITTTPSYYPALLQSIAALGIVVIASDSTSVTADLMTQGLDWMIQQNDQAGDYQGKLNTSCLITIGYSLGGGAAVTAGSHANVVTTVSFHGVQGSSNTLHSPLLLITSDTDTFVVPAQFVTPTYNASVVQTFYATLSAAGDPSNYGHLIPVLDVARYEQPVALAWLRLFVYGDQSASPYFYGDTCTACVAPWDPAQRKNWP